MHRNMFWDKENGIENYFSLSFLFFKVILLMWKGWDRNCLAVWVEVVDNVFGFGYGQVWRLFLVRMFGIGNIGVLRKS